LVLGYNWTTGWPPEDLDEMGNYSVSRLRFLRFYEPRGGTQECQGARLQGRHITVFDVYGEDLDSASGVDCELLYLKGTQITATKIYGKNACRRQGIVAIKEVGESSSDGFDFVVRDVQ